MKQLLIDTSVYYGIIDLVPIEKSTKTVGNIVKNVGADSMEVQLLCGIK